jgi:hypothetical protein
MKLLFFVASLLEEFVTESQDFQEPGVGVKV